MLSPEDLSRVAKRFDEALDPLAKGRSRGRAPSETVKPEYARVGDPSVERALEKTAAGLRNGRREAVVPAQSAAARKISLQLTSSEAAAKGELEGRALGQAAATALERHQARQADFSLGLWKLYEDLSQKDQSVIWDRFKADVTKAYRGGSAGSAGNEFVTRAARALNDMVVEPAVRQMKDLEMIARDTSPGLLSRVIDLTKVIAGMEVFRDIVSEWASNAISNQIQNIIDPRSDEDEVAPPHSWNRDEESGFLNAADRAAYVDEVVDGIVGNVTGRAPFEGPDWVVPVTHGPLKGRLFDIPDALIDDFLEHDVEVIADTFTRKTAPEIELTRAFGSAGMETAFADLKADYDLRIAQAGSDEERQSLEGEYERVSKMLADFREGLRDNTRVEQTASVWNSATRAARARSNAGSSGDGMSGPLAEVAHMVAGRGVTGFMKDALPDLVSGARAARITRQDARDFSAILETVAKARMASLTGLTNPFATKSAAETLADSLDDRFSRGSAINWWNATMKDALSVYTMNRIAKTVITASEGAASEGAGSRAGEDETRADFGTLSRRRRGYMDRLGIDENIAIQIGDQTRKHGARENGIWGLNLAKWDDAGARRVMLDAIAEEVDRVPARDGGSDMPQWARSNLGQLVMRFKSHLLDAHQGVLFSRLSGRPKHLAEFLTTGASMGMLNVYLDHIAEGDFEGAKRLIEQPEDWIVDGLGRVGVLPVLLGQ
ncbi:hypothetical protein [Roseibium sp.]|uniref:hypothetical protein n=1 Tax=Roseibium sp. TaxID=1936156 RepID=UPI003A9804F1